MRVALANIPCLCYIIRRKGKSSLEKHNKNDVPHTSKYKPWRIKNAIAFENKEKAYAFEAYLKTTLRQSLRQAAFLRFRRGKPFTRCAYKKCGSK